MSSTVTLRPAPARAEPTAWELLQRAQGFVQKWPEGFRGFRARLLCATSDEAVEGAVIVACGREPVVDLDPPGLRQLVHTRLLDCADERTPRFFKDGDGRFAVRREPDVDGERWIRVERPDATIRYRLDVRGRIGAVERLDRQCQRLTVIEEYARATPGRVLPARRQTTTRAISTGARLAWEELREAHCRVDHVWLPAAWDLVAGNASGSHALRFEVLAHRLL